jgi:hypothetical protein
MNWLTEGRLLNLVLIEARKAGVFAMHNYSGRTASETGWPDLALCAPGGGLFKIREIKVGKGTLNLAQARWLRALKAAGLDAGVWTEDDWWAGRIQQEIAEMLPAQEPPMAA